MWDGLQPCLWLFLELVAFCASPGKDTLPTLQHVQFLRQATHTLSTTSSLPASALATPEAKKKLLAIQTKI